MPGPDGKIGHAELEIGDSVVMLADEHPDMNFRGPTSVGGTSVTLHLYVTDVDETLGKATAAGATIVRPVENQFYGDRTGEITDPFGYRWYLSTHVEDVPDDELRRRAAEREKARAAERPRS